MKTGGDAMDMTTRVQWAAVLAIGAVVMFVALLALGMTLASLRSAALLSWLP